jgi:hypothetical protein
MLRVVLEVLLFFVVPFALYAGWLVLQQRYPLVAEHWSRGVLYWLALAGLACAVVGVLTLGTMQDHGRGSYQPAVVKDGQLVPGHFE